MKASNFDIRISKEAAMELIKPAHYTGTGNGCLKDEIGIEVMCKEYGQDEEWVAVEPDDYYNLVDDPHYATYELWLKEEHKRK